MTLHPTRILQDVTAAPMLLEVLVGDAAGEEGLTVVIVGFDGGEASDARGLAEEGAGGAGGG